MTERRPARKRARAGAGGPDTLDETARAHSYRTVEERIARGLAWRETAPIEGHAADMLASARFALLLRHDDAGREFAYDTGAEKALAAAGEHGWTVVSMKHDFGTIF